MTGKREDEREQEPAAAVWRPLSEAFGTGDPLFARILFLPGYGFSSNIYVVTGDGLTIVDPGNDYTAFMDLFGADFEPADIRRIILTHGHRDHAMGAFELMRSHRAVDPEGGPELILHAAGPREFKEAAREIGCRVTEVKGGETLEFGGVSWEVIHTPGHTIDGICLHHAASRTAMTGDVVLPHAMAEPDPAAGGRLDHYLAGLRELLKREIDHVLPGHGPPVASAGRRVVEETYVGVMMKIIGVEAGSKTPWIEGATRLARSGFLDEALFCCERELALRPADPRALRVKVVFLNDLGRFAEALETIERIESSPAVEGRDLFARICKGYALMGLGKYEDSIRFFDEALGLRPGVKDALVYKGMALYLSGRQEEALDIEPFRTEFVGRFREEIRKKAGAPAPPGPGASPPSSG